MVPLKMPVATLAKGSQRQLESFLNLVNMQIYKNHLQGQTQADTHQVLPPQSQQFAAEPHQSASFQRQMIPTASRGAKRVKDNHKGLASQTD